MSGDKNNDVSYDHTDHPGAVPRAGDHADLLARCNSHVHAHLCLKPNLGAVPRAVRQRVHHLRLHPQLLRVLRRA